MTVSTPPAAAGRILTLPLSLRIALRELRGDARGLAIFVVCIALGVAAMAAVGSLAAAFDSGLAREGRILLGGDIEAEVVHRQATPEEHERLARLGQVSEIASIRTMVRNQSGQTALIELKAVDDVYPLYGEVRASGGAAQGVDALRAEGAVVLDPLLLGRLELSIGDRVRIGEGEFTIGARLDYEPDTASGRLTLGPHALMSLKNLERSKLVQPGTLVRWSYRVKLPGDVGRAELADIRRDLRGTLAKAGYELGDWTNPSPTISRAVQRFADFLSLAALTSLLIGGLGVANAMSTYIGKKRSVIAAYKCLGASSATIFRIYLLQALLLAAIGIAAGLVVGAAVPFIVAESIGALPLPLSLAPQVGPLLAAAAAGLFTALLFVLAPLGNARDVPAAALMRAEVADEGMRSPPLFLALAAGCAVILVLLAVATSSSKLVTLWVCLGVAALFGLFAGLGFLIRNVAARLRRPRSASLRVALSGLTGPGSLARPVTLSLGLGLSLLVGVALVERALVSEFETEIPTNAPSYFFIDIPNGQQTVFAAKARAVAPDLKISEAPMLRGRIVSVKGAPAEQIKLNDDTRWVLSGDRGLTYSDSVPEASKVVAGEWWPQDYVGPPLVSFEREIADALGLKIGDGVTVNVLGRNVDAKVSNLRTVDWESLAINFVMVFPRSTLAAAPHNHLATVKLKNDEDRETEARLVQSMIEAYPTVSAVRVRDVVAAAELIVSRVLTTISVAAGITLLIGAVVLAGAVATAQRGRMREAVLFKTLGATRGLILRAHLAEYAILAVITAAVAALVGGTGAWAITTFALDTTFVFAPMAVLQALVLALVLVLGLGLAATARALSAKAAPHLRGE